MSRLILYCLLASLAGVPAAAAAAGKPPYADGPAAAQPAAGKSAHEPGRRRLSKFEARQIRHACRGNANERGLTGSEREAYLSRCYFGRVTHRAERQQCRQEAAARGVERGALRAYVRECVRERVRVKEEKKGPTPPPLQ